MTRNYINDLPQTVSNKSLLFADDTSLFANIASKAPRQPAAQSLERDLQNLSDWADTWQVRFNPSKTQLLPISRKKDSAKLTDIPVHFQGKRLEETQNLKLLGV